MDLGDPVVAAHLELLRVFLGSGPIEQLRAIALGAPNSYARELSRSPEYAASLRAIGDDPPLRSMFATTGAPTCRLMSPTLGIDLDARILPAGFIASAVLTAIFSGTTIDEESLGPLVAKAVSQMRAIARDGAAQLPVAIAFDGFNLEEAIETPLGRLAPAAEAWSYVTSGHDRSSVDCLTEISVHVGDPGERQLLDDLADIVARADSFRAAVVVAANGETNVRPSTKLVTVIHPYIGFIGMVAPGHSSLPTPVSRSLTSSERDLVTVSLNEMSRYGGSNIDVAFRRLLSAVVDRAAAADRLIDAVTAWENLVGTASETSFRVCAAMAWLLEEDSGERRKTFDRLRNIYGIRSRVVHGERVDRGAVENAAAAAIAATLGATRAALLNKQWLLSLPTATSRANALLLGDEPPRDGH